MDITSSQKKSTPNSTTSKETNTAASPENQTPPYANRDEQYDRSFDMVERIRLAREAAEKKRNAFSGNLDDYVLVRRIVGQKSVREQQRKLEEEKKAVPTGKGQLSLDLDKETGEESK